MQAYHDLARNKRTTHEHRYRYFKTPYPHSALLHDLNLNDIRVTLQHQKQHEKHNRPNQSQTITECKIDSICSLSKYVRQEAHSNFTNLLSQRWSKCRKLQLEVEISHGNLPVFVPTELKMIFTQTESPSENELLGTNN